MKRLRQLEEENGKPKKIGADLSLDKAMLQDVIRGKFLKLARQRQMGFSSRLPIAPPSRTNPDALLSRRSRICNMCILFQVRHHLPTKVL